MPETTRTAGPKNPGTRKVISSVGTPGGVGGGSWGPRAALAGLCLVAACGGETSAPTEKSAAEAAAPESDYPPTAQVATAESMLADLATPRHPSDGGGHAWIESEEGAPRARVGTPGSWRIVYEAGPLGVSDGGLVALLVDPFWEWSTPQADVPEAPGYVEVSTAAEGVTLEPRTLDRFLLGVAVRGRALVEGERITLDYGAGRAGAVPDRFADRATHFWIRVDGDGDGVSELIESNPTLDVHPGPPAGLLVHWPSTARPGERVEITAALVDARANALWEFEGGTLAFDAHEGLEDLPATVELDANSIGRAKVSVTPSGTGVLRLRARVTLGDGRQFEAVSNPCLVLAEQPRIVWADLHGHSNLSDGTGTPEDFFTYARDVAGLEVAALTDHDHWGVRFLDQHADMWERIGETVENFHEPGRFVTLLAYEWTSWIYGHRHVLYFEDEGEVYSSVDEATDTPQELWDALRGQEALTFAHHSAGGPVATDWSIPPDPVLEPLTEITSVHGSSEAMDSPAPIYRPLRGNFVRDILERYTLGFVGSGDGHDGHPGLTHLINNTGGLAAIITDDLTREGVLEALRSRRCYATNGPRIVLRAALSGFRMGSEVPAAELGDAPSLTFFAVGTEPLAAAELIRSGEIVDGVAGDGRYELSHSFALADLALGEFVYVRVVQTGGGTAWSSPFFIR